MDALGGLEVEPFARVGPLDAYLEVEFLMLKEEICGKRFHALAAQQHDVVTAFHGDVDARLRIPTVPPADYGVGIIDVKSEPGVAIDVEAINRHLARIGYGSGGEGLPAGREGDPEEQHACAGDGA